MRTPHLFGLDDLSGWIDDVQSRGATRIELWFKVRGAEQTRVLIAKSREPNDAADEILAHVERDPRIAKGTAVYAVFAYRDDQPTMQPERAFVLPDASMRTELAPAVAPHGASPMLGAQILDTVVSTMTSMTQGIFTASQRENERQGRLIEQLAKNSTGQFEAFAKAHSDTIEALKRQLTDAYAMVAQKNQELEEQRQATAKIAEACGVWEKNFEELSEMKTQEKVAANRDILRDNFLHQTASLLTPIALSKAFGTKLAESHFGSAVLRRFSESLTPKQLEAIVGLLSDAQKAAFASILTELRTGKRAEEASPTEPSKPKRARTKVNDVKAH